MPSNDLEEIRKIINLHAGRYTPYSRDEIVIDYLCTQIPGQHYTNVLLIIVNRKVVERCFQILAKAGVELEKIFIPAEAMSRFYQMIALGHAGGAGAIGGVHIGLESSDLTITEHDKMVFVRNIPIGSAQLSKDPEVSGNEFVMQLKQSLSAYQDQGVGKPVGRFFITGLTQNISILEGKLKGLNADSAQPQLSIKILSYADQFIIDKEPLKFITESKGSYFDLFVALMFSTSNCINLTPVEVKMKKRVRESAKDIISLGILVMTGLLLISVFFATKIYLKQLRLGELDGVYEKTEEDARYLERASTKTRALRQLLEKRGAGLFVFEKFSGMVGEDIYLSYFEYDQEEQILILGGTAESMSRVFAFVTDLEDSPYFQDVEAEETKTRKAQGVEVADFRITCKIPEGSYS